ncbi:hypothetical protein KIN20_003481 [Parelaphostrongylus tenuis]|uniref:Uncharacterized protein n=1 Tax=Parelaphostrongylus tenuis TaxID=148309 RepID=A0AAD5LXC9_PARTN|nr:hypothetical protein KIN20_003481 [Parelaphostrongylus tenuis]
MEKALVIRKNVIASRGKTETLRDMVIVITRVTQEPVSSAIYLSSNGCAVDAQASLSTRELDTESFYQKPVWNHLQQLDHAHKKPRQDPHELTKVQANRCEQFAEAIPHITATH